MKLLKQKLFYNMKTENTGNQLNTRRLYDRPQFVHVKIDNEISLSLQSEPLNPDEPGMSYNSVINIRSHFFFNVT